jgi:GTPase SAR1 family protein
VNNIGDSGAERIAEALKINSSLTTLYLSGASHGPVGPLLRVFLVGDGGAGKTSVVAALRREPFSDTSSTDGVDVSTFSLDTGAVLAGRDWEHLYNAMRAEISKPKPASQPPVAAAPSIIPKPAPLRQPDRSVIRDIMDAKEEEVDGERIVAFADKHIREKVANERIGTTWDLAGQSQYFSTHRLFLSQRALYVVVVNLHPEEQKFYDVKAKAKDEDPLAFLKRRCEYWRDYLHLKAPGQRYIVVFTHADANGLSADMVRSRLISAPKFSVSPRPPSSLDCRTPNLLRARWTDTDVAFSLAWTLSAALSLSNSIISHRTKVRSTRWDSSVIAPRNTDTDAPGERTQWNATKELANRGTDRPRW